jgi:hypothetical protein
MLQHSLRWSRLLIGRNIGRTVPNRFAYGNRYLSSKNDGTKSTEMVVQGLTMNYLWNEFIPACGGIEKVKDKTMTEVYKEFIHPKITDTTAFCEVISKDRKPAGVIDNPKYFISYLNTSLFLDVLTSVETHLFLSNPKGATEMMNKEGLFIDLFSNTRQENSEGWVETVLTRYHAIKPTLLYLFLPFNNNLSLFHHNFAEIVSAVISPVPIQFVLGHHYHQKTHFLSSNSVSASSASSLASGPLKELMNSLVLEEDLLLKIDNYQFHDGEKEFLNELLPLYYSKEEVVSVATIRERVVHRFQSAFLSLTQLFVAQNALSTQEKYAWELAFANSLFRNGHYQEVETLLFNALKGLLNTSEQEISPEKKNALVQDFRLAFARLYLFDNKTESFQQYYNNYLSGVRENISSLSIKELKEFNDLYDAQKQVDLQQENENQSTIDVVNDRRKIPDEEHRLAIECKKRLLGEFDQETFAAKVKYSNLLMKREFSQLTGEDAKFILTLLADLEFINKHFSSLKSEESVVQYHVSILAAKKEIQEHINDLKFFLIHYYYQGGLKEKADPLSNSFFALYELINSLDFEEASVVDFFRLQLLPDEKKHGVIYEIFKTFLGTGSFEKAEIFLQNIFEIPPDSDLQSNDAKLSERTECSTIKSFNGPLFTNLMIEFAEKTQRFPMFDSRYLRNPFIPDIHPTEVIAYCNNRYSSKHNEASTVIIKMQMMLHFANFYYQIGRYSLCIDFCLENIGEAGQFQPESTKPPVAPTLSLETNPLDRQPNKDLEQSIHSVGILTLLTGIPLCASFYQMSEAEIANDNLLQYYNHFLSSATSPMSVGSFSPDFLVQMAYIGWKKHDFANAEKLYRSYIDRLSKKTAGAEGSTPENGSRPKKWISKPLYYNQSEALKSLGNIYLEQGEQRAVEAKLCMSEAQQILKIYFPEYQQQR